MKTIEVKLYKFDELSEEAKQRVINDFLFSDREFFWGEEGLETIKQGLDFFGFSLGNYSIDFSSANRSYVHFSGSFDFYAEDFSGVRLWKYLMKNYIFESARHNKRGESILRGNCPFTGYCLDENFLDPIRKFIERPTNISFKELMEKCVYEALKGIEQDYDYQNSEEFAIEEITNDDLDYLEDGSEF